LGLHEHRQNLSFVGDHPLKYHSRVRRKVLEREGLVSRPLRFGRDALSEEQLSADAARSQFFSNEGDHFVLRSDGSKVALCVESQCVRVVGFADENDLFGPPLSFHLAQQSGAASRAAREGAEQIHERDRSSIRVLVHNCHTSDSSNVRTRFLRGGHLSRVHPKMPLMRVRLSTRLCIYVTFAKDV